MRNKIQQTSFEFLRKLRSFLSVKEREQEAFLAEAVVDSKQHNHYSIAYKHSLHLVTSRNYKMNVASISWSELSVFIDGIGRDQLIHSGHAYLNILGEECRVFVTQSYIGESLAGYQLVHENSDDLKPLQDFILCLKTGASLRFIYKNKNKSEDDLDRVDEIVMVGQRSTKLRISLDANGFMTSCRLSFYFGEDHFELIYQDKILHLEPSVRVASTMVQATRCGIGILLGVQQTKIIRLLRPVFATVLHALPHPAEHKEAS